jgi:acyl-CoA carboxylase subunit alpha
VRVDSSVTAGSVVTVDFDPMLGKVIAHAPTRREAAGRLALAIERLHLGGVTTNRDFLASALRTEAFLEGDTTTDFIDRVVLDTVAPRAVVERAAVAGALWLQGANRAADSIWPRAPSNWRNARLPAEYITFAPAGGDSIRVAYRADRDGSFRMDPAGRAVVFRWSTTDIDLAVDGLRCVSLVTRAGDSLHVQTPSSTVELRIEPRFAVQGTATPTGGVVAPMPGAVIDLRVETGQSVEAGQLLVVLEAMKMEHHLTAPVGGVVSSVAVSIGQQVDNGALLLTIDTGESGVDDV